MKMQKINAKSMKPTLDVSSPGRMRNPFIILNANTSTYLTISKETEFVELRNDTGLDLKHSITNTHIFWFSLNIECFNKKKKEKKVEYCKK